MRRSSRSPSSDPRVHVRPKPAFWTGRPGPGPYRRPLARPDRRNRRPPRRPLRTRRGKPLGSQRRAPGGVAHGRARWRHGAALLRRPRATRSAHDLTRTDARGSGTRPPPGPGMPPMSSHFFRKLCRNRRFPVTHPEGMFSGGSGSHGCGTRRGEGRMRGTVRRWTPNGPMITGHRPVRSQPRIRHIEVRPTRCDLSRQSPAHSRADHPRRVAIPTRNRCQPQTSRRPRKSIQCGKYRQRYL